MQKIKSPIYYTGNKYRLIDELKDLIPFNINTFVDVFGGSGTMAINFAARSNKVIYNEFNVNILNMFNWLLKQDYNDLHERIVSLAKDWDFPSNVTQMEKLTEEQYDYFKNQFYLFREFVNETGLQHDPFYMYFITHYSFCNTISHNKKGMIDISYGARFYKREITAINLNYSQYALSKVKFETYNLSFEKLLTDEFLSSLTVEDFVYLDPPYFGTKASYNKLWNEKHEMLLLELIEKIHSKGVKFGLSNIYKNKHIYNKHLEEWAAKNDFYVYHPQITYNFGPNGDSESLEVYITNVRGNEQQSLF